MHTLANVYRHVLRTVCQEYPGMNPIEASGLPMPELMRYYNDMRPALEQRTRPKR